ncbi:MAG: ABC transporter permease [Clostridia bacterium]|nr:ABC transporter permease [Clostridia bacterium]
MRAYASIFKIRFINTMQYRTAAYAGVITQICFGLMYVFLYLAFYKQGNIPENFTATQMVSFLWLQQMFFVYFFPIDQNKNIVGQIEQGNICYEMVRPMKLYNNWSVTLFAEKVAKTLLRFVPVLIFAILLPTGVGLELPASAGAFFLSLFNLIVSGLLIVAMNMVCYCLLFKTMSSLGIFSIYTTIASLLGGSLIPIPMMPGWIQNILNFLPFRYTSDLTFRTYVGSIDIQSALIQTAIQVGWLMLFVVLGKVLMNRCLKKVEVQGG